MDVNAARLGITRNESFTAPWGKGQPVPATDLFHQADILETIDLEKSTVQNLAYRDNDDSQATGRISKDLDPAKGRILVKQVGADSPELQSGKISSSVFQANFHLDADSTVVPDSFDIVTEEKNISRHAEWKNGEFQNAREERVLADGSRELLELTTDSARGTLTYTTTYTAAA